jgi:hypothetical protein
VDDSRQPEEDAEDDVDDEVFPDTLLEEDCERWQ